MGGLATPFTNHQQHTNTMSTANHSVSKYRNQAQKLEEKQSCGAHQTDNGRVGWDHHLQIHTSRLPRMIRNNMFTRLYQAPCQLCLTTSLLGTDGISHEGPRFFSCSAVTGTSISLKAECMVHRKDYSSIVQIKTKRQKQCTTAQLQHAQAPHKILPPDIKCIDLSFRGQETSMMIPAIIFRAYIFDRCAAEVNVAGRRQW